MISGVMQRHWFKYSPSAEDLVPEARDFVDVSYISLLENVTRFTYIHRTIAFVGFTCQSEMVSTGSA
jgi:hypothetical protein